jgi:predicted small secreted protein
VTGAPRGLRALAVAVVLAAPLLAGCEAAQQAQQGADNSGL